MPPEKDTQTPEQEPEVKEPEIEPGQTDPDTGKYTDEGIAALVEKIKAGNVEVKDKEPEKDSEPEPEVGKDKMVPISRLNEVIDERNRLREQVNSKSNLQQTTQTPANESKSIDDLRGNLRSKRTEWQAAIFDNDADKAAKLLAEMDSLEEQIDDIRINEASSMTRVQSADDVRYDNLLDKLKADYPVIDKSSDDFDQKIVTEMYNMREAFIAKGDLQSEALEKAARYILQPLGNPKKAKETAETRVGDSKKNLADALTRQPTNVADLGASADAVNNEFGIDINRLTPDQFDKLPEDIKTKLRGDEIKEHHLGVR